MVSQVIIEGNRIILELGDPDKVHKFIEFLRALGLTSVRERTLRIRYDEGFELYLRNDRGYQERTIRDYMNYLKKLDGKELNYRTYLEICSNSWTVKTVRLYIDYLYKNEVISWEEYNRLLYIFRTKSEDNVSNVEVDVEELISPLFDERAKDIEIIVFKILLYSGVRFSEVIKMINEFDEKKMVCFSSFCRYKLMWKRGKKRCDWIYIPKELASLISRYAGWYRGRDYHNIERALSKKYSVDVGLFRKFFYRVCRKLGDKELCDFFQGRIGKLSTGDKHYDELLNRCDELYPAIVRRIEKLIDEVLSEMSGVYGYIDTDEEEYYIAIPLDEKRR